MMGNNGKEYTASSLIIQTLDWKNPDSFLLKNKETQEVVTEPVHHNISLLSRHQQIFLILPVKIPELTQNATLITHQNGAENFYTSHPELNPKNPLQNHVQEGWGSRMWKAWKMVEDSKGASEEWGFLNKFNHGHTGWRGGRS